VKILEIDGVPVPREEPEPVSETEAAGLRDKPALVTTGRGDIPLLEFKKEAV
jgi:hypothetical protein